MSKPDLRDRREYFRSKRSDPEFIAAEKHRAKLRQSAPDYADKERERGRRRRAAQKDCINSWARIRHAERMAEDVAYKQSKARNSLQWCRNNPEKVLASYVRRRGVIPAWASKHYMKEMYEIAAAYRLNCGLEAEVDHIVPLVSPIVCGLHTPDNLQIITPFENRSKGNRHWPDMP